MLLPCSHAINRKAANRGAARCGKAEKCPSYLEVLQTVLVHDVYPAQFGDREVQQRTADCHRPVALPNFLDLSLRASTVGEAVGNRLTHCLGLAKRGDECLCEMLTVAGQPKLWT